MPVAPVLLEMLVCPEDKGPLWYVAGEDALYNERLKRRYPIRNGNIPVLLVDDSEIVGDDEHQRILATVESESCIRTGTAASEKRDAHND